MTLVVIRLGLVVSVVMLRLCMVILGLEGKEEKEGSKVTLEDEVAWQNDLHFGRALGWINPDEAMVRFL